MTSSITSIAALYVEITRLLDGEDPTPSDISAPTLKRLISVAQKRIYRDVKSRWNEKPFTMAVTDNAATLPVDYETARIVHFGERALIPVDESVIRDYRMVSNGRGRYFAHSGDTLIFWPSVADGTQVQGSYYARLDDLTDANMAANALFQAADDLFVYGSLIESAPFFGDDTRMPVWESKYEAIVRSLNLANHRAAYGAGRLMVRPSARICGRGVGANPADNLLETSLGEVLVQS